MNQGDVVVCRDSRSYAFTEGKEYTITKFIPSIQTGWFTFPTYVEVTDDTGRTVECYAHRFIKKESS